MTYFKTNSVATKLSRWVGNLNLLSDPSNRENNKNLTGLEYRWFMKTPPRSNGG